MNDTYDVIDCHTGNKVNAKPYSSRKRATTRADKLDSAYGAVRYVVRTNFADEGKRPYGTFWALIGLECDRQRKIEATRK